MKRAKFTKGILVSVSPELQQKIKKAAYKNGMSMSAWLRNLAEMVLRLTKAGE